MVVVGSSHATVEVGVEKERPLLSAKAAPRESTTSTATRTMTVTPVTFIGGPFVRWNVRLAARHSVGWYQVAEVLSRSG